MSIDSRYLDDMGPFTVRAYLEYDNDTRPDDSDCYSEADIAAWQEDEWQYVTLFVEVLHDDKVLGTACIGGMEYGLNGNYEYAWSTDYYLPDLIDEAVAEARQYVAKMKGIEVEV